MLSHVNQCIIRVTGRVKLPSPEVGTEGQKHSTTSSRRHHDAVGRQSNVTFSPNKTFKFSFPDRKTNEKKVIKMIFSHANLQYFRNYIFYRKMHQEECSSEHSQPTMTDKLQILPESKLTWNLRQATHKHIVYRKNYIFVVIRSNNWRIIVNLLILLPTKKFCL